MSAQLNVELYELIEDLPPNSSVAIEADEGAMTPEGDSLVRGDVLSVLKAHADGLIHCCFTGCVGGSCRGMVFDEVTGRELEPDALPAIKFKRPGTRITGVVRRAP